MAYKSPISGSKLTEVQRQGGIFHLDTVTGDEFSQAYAKENLETFEQVKKPKSKAPKKAEDKKPAAKKSDNKKSADKKDKKQEEEK